MSSLDGQYFGSFRSREMWPKEKLISQQRAEERFGPDGVVIRIIDAELARRAREDAAAVAIARANTPVRAT